MSNFFYYARISTKEERGLQKFNRQLSAIESYAKANGIEFVAGFEEDESGKNFENRKEWGKLERLVQSGDCIVFKDISRFTRETENGYKKYMELLEKGVELLFLDNPTVSTNYIKTLLRVAEEQSIVAKVSLESTIKLLLLVELDRVEREREILIKRIKDGISASSKRQGRKQGQLDKMSEELREDILLFLKDRTITHSSLIQKHGISRNTLKKYIERVREEQE